MAAHAGRFGFLMTCKYHPALLNDGKPERSLNPVPSTVKWLSAACSSGTDTDVSSGVLISSKYCVLASTGAEKLVSCGMYPIEMAPLVRLGRVHELKGRDPAVSRFTDVSWSISSVVNAPLASRTCPPTVVNAGRLTVLT